MKNNKGQALVTFILFLPILFILFSIIIDIGFCYNEKKHVDGIIKYSVEYGLKHMDSVDLENALINIIDDNVKDIEELIVDVDNGVINIKINKKNKGIFSHLLDIDYFKVESNYEGYISNDKLIINRK